MWFPGDIIILNIERNQGKLPGKIYISLSLKESWKLMTEMMESEDRGIMRLEKILALKRPTKIYEYCEDLELSGMDVIKLIKEDLEKTDSWVFDPLSDCVENLWRLLGIMVK